MAFTAGTGIAEERRQGIAQTVMPLLRDGDIERALKSLETVLDRPVANPLIGNEELSVVGASLHRSLSQLSSDAQFELLSKWSMPSESPTKIRIFTALVPTLAPPIEFARALGERPRSTSFPVSSIGEVQGIVSTAWSLVIAAREAGLLKRLMTDVGLLVEKKVPNADLLFALAQIADGKGEISKLSAQLSKRVDGLRTAARSSGEPGLIIDPNDVVIACASLQHSTLRPLGEEMLEVLLERTHGQASPIVRPFLRKAHATAVLMHHQEQGSVGVAAKLAPRLKYWIPVTGDLESLDGRSNGGRPAFTDSVWLTQEDHILHLAGSGNDTLQFRYPLLGNFRFECETEARLGAKIETDGGVIYGGQRYQVTASTAQCEMTDPGNRVTELRFCAFIRQPSTSAPNRLAIDLAQGSATMSVNLHPMWKDNANFQASPWLGLKSLGELQPLFRNLKLTGQPTIPRSVQLIEGNKLRGWQSRVFGKQDDLEASVDPEWRLTDGMLQAANCESKTSSSTLQHVLAYQRPLLPGEAISYEFFYEPGVCEVGPALGRVAFLLQPDGVRIHWITDGERDWTGLSPENSLTEPLNRRGPRPLPFKMNEWNRVTMSRTDGAVTLSLNDVNVYHRPVDWSGDHRFSFYRPSAAVEARVRRASLVGDWPETVPIEFLDNPAITFGPPMSIANRRALNRLFQESVLAGNIFAARDRALKMPLAERLEFLTQWVVPGADHRRFRVTGDFTQTQPSPLAFQPGVRDPGSGAQVVSLVFDWLDAAKELGRLDECRRKVEQAVTDQHGSQDRARTALLMLLSLEQGNATETASNFEKLLGLLQAQTPIGIEDQWPETLIAVRGARHFGNSPAVRELVSYLYLQRVSLSRPEGINLWHTHIAGIFGRLMLQTSESKEGEQRPPRGLTNWIPVTAARSGSRGQGYPVPVWSRHDSTVTKHAGHVEDYLFYRQPLSGEFEVECEFLQPTQNSSLIMLDGKCVGVQGGLEHLIVGSFGSPPRLQPLDLPLISTGQLMRYRGVVRDAKWTVYLNGRAVQSDVRQEISDPWIAIRSQGRHLNAVQDLRITGRPTVLDSVSLSDSEDLVGWVEYHEESISGEDGRWRYVADPKSSGAIIGRANPHLVGTNAESLLRYQRPLVEDGSIEYEFFYEPGKTDTHPALDRLAFILQPSGIREHWITDGRYDRTDLPPDNLAAVPQHNRGPAEMPLNPGEWNRLRLILNESTVQIELNGALVYERKLEAENVRTFGLFHFADLTEARVRNVVMRGDWSKSLPLLSDQELAASTTDVVEFNSSHLKSSFTHVFQSDGLPEKYFKLSPPLPGSQSKITDQGFEVNSTGTGSWTYTQISPRFTLSGDFDIEAQFDRLRMECSERSTSIQLNVTFADPSKPEFGLNRMLVAPNLSGVYSSRNIAKSAGERIWIAKDDPYESLSGRFQLSRRGKTAYFLFADGDSVNFKLMDTQTAPDGDTELDGIRLHSLCQSVGMVDAVWKRLALRAERMAWHPDASMIPAEALYVMQLDGKRFRTVATPEKSGFTKFASPEWSSDGRMIAVEMSNGAKATSHIAVLNADGSELKDLGPGCIPSFSQAADRLVCSQPLQGIVTMNVDGSDRRVIDAAGWGAQWSPDGKWIAYGKAGNIRLLNVETGMSHPLLVDAAANRYGYIYANFGWSHDSRSIAFKARCRDVIRDELVVAELDSADGCIVLHSDARAILPDFTFSPDNQQVLFGFEDPRAPGTTLYAVNRNRPDECQMFPDQPAGLKVTGSAWSHDGKSIVFTGSIPFVNWNSSD